MISKQYQTNTNMKDQIVTKSNGFLSLLMQLILLAASIYSVTKAEPLYIGLGVAGIVILIFLMNGFLILMPNEAAVLTFFGKYEGTIVKNGFYWMNPFIAKKKINFRARNLNGPKLKVNDSIGNPIEIAAVVVWQVEDAFKASFDVDNYTHYIEVQSEAAIRKLASMYPYDEFEDATSAYTLRASADHVNQELEKELQDRLARAGVIVIEARISHLAYAQEIAGAMLQRQQATAVVAARKQIVDGAVGMVEMALEKLAEKNVVNLDEERKAAMVSNLLVVLCSDRAVSPVVNTGTLHH